MGYFPLRVGCYGHLIRCAMDIFQKYIQSPKKTDNEAGFTLGRHEPLPTARLGMLWNSAEKALLVISGAVRGPHNGGHTVVVAMQGLATANLLAR